MKKIIIPVILFAILLVGCSGDKKDNKDNGSKDRQEKTTTEMTTEEPQKLATPTPTPLPDDLAKVEHYEKGGSELGDVVEYEDGKVAKVKEYDHNNFDEEYQTTYYYEEDLLIKEETVYNGIMSKVNFENRLRGYTLYSYNDHKLLSKKLVYGENDELKEEYYYLYDEFGYMQTTRIGDGRKTITMTAPNDNDVYLEIYDEKGILKERRDYEYEYDKAGNELKRSVVVDGKVQKEWVSEYDKVGNNTKTSTYEYGTLTTVQSTEFAPDNSWKMTTLDSYDNNGNIVGTRYFYRAYNENGQEIEFWYSDEEDMTPAEDIFYTYDKDGNILSMVNGDITTLYEYDNKGRLIEECSFYKDEVSYCYKYSYEG
ncbi:MAG: hypothetical protein J6U54_22815 [Clostridiales bacterium]|nr:hypothetical protein [Clostridiales bacterium]